jgi:hypothetical protein
MRRAWRVVMVLTLVGCSTASSPPNPLTDLDTCVERRDPAYMAMRETAIEVMTEQGLDLSDTLAGLEASAKVRTIPGVMLSSEDSVFLKRHGFFGVYGGTPFSLARFAALRTCMRERHGYAIRTIEVRTP